MTTGSDNLVRDAAMKAFTERTKQWWLSIGQEEVDAFTVGWEQAWKAAMEATALAPTPPHPNTVRVRIPVVTTHDCRHFAYRSHEDTDSEADEYIRGRLCAAGSIVSWITADVPLPSPPVEVKGTVEP